MRNKSPALRTGAILLALFSFLPLTAYADIEITLKNTFIEKFKNRATIDTTPGRNAISFPEHGMPERSAQTDKQ